MNTRRLRHSIVSLAVCLVATVASAVSTVEPDSLNFSTVVVGEPEEMTFVMTNGGPVSVSGTAHLSGTWHWKFGNGNTAHSYDLAPGESETVTVRVQSTYGGPLNGTITLGPIGDDAGVPLIHCYGYGSWPSEPGEPDCSLTPFYGMQFPPTVVGQEATDRIWVSNRNGGTEDPPTGVIVGTMPYGAGDFHIPWGGPFAVPWLQTWDVYWRPQTPGWHSVILDMPEVCNEGYGPFEMSGLALFDGTACDLSVTDLDLGLVGVGETSTGVIDITNVGTETLSLTIPEWCGPFHIVEGPMPRNLASATGMQLHVEFTPTEPGLQTCMLDLGQGACATVELSGVGLADSGAPDRIGIWFEESGATDQFDTTVPFEEVTAYLMIQNPSTQWGASGWECCVEMTGDGVGLSWDLAGTPLNVETPPCFSVGMQAGVLSGTHTIVLATLTFLQPDPEAPTFFFVHPSSSPSLPGVAVYADGIDPGHLIPLSPASGSETIPVAMVNAPPTATDEVPGRTVLAKAQPNPFNPSTTLYFETAREGAARLAIHDLRGRRVRTLVDGMMPGGVHQQVWDGRDEAGRTVESGVYFARLEAGGERRMLKVMLLK